MPLELSSEVKARIQQIVARYPNSQAALLPTLHLLQRELGCLSIEAQEAVATILGVPPTLVHEVTTFYEMFHEHREGQFHFEFCTNIACHLAGADQLLGHVQKKLCVGLGHQTEDGLFSIMEAECLASCGSGPTLKVGMDYYEYLSIPAVDALLARFREMAPELAGRAYVHGPEGPHVGAVSGFEPSQPVDVPEAATATATATAAETADGEIVEPAVHAADRAASGTGV